MPKFSSLFTTVQEDHITIQLLSDFLQFSSECSENGSQNGNHGYLNKDRQKNKLSVKIIFLQFSKISKQEYEKNQNQNV